MSNLSRRSFLTSCLGAATLPAFANTNTHVVPDHQRPRIIKVGGAIRPGEIHVIPDQFALLWALPDGRAVRYAVGIGRAERYTSGVFRVGQKKEWPRWTPTRNMIRREPHLYAPHAAGMAPGGANPLGARALYLYNGRRDSLLRIHGTPHPWSIETRESNGCVRMVNEHVADLYERVPIGTRVVLH